MIGALFMAGVIHAAVAAPGAPTGLMCELMDAPALTVITDDAPEFCWVVNDSRRGAVQSAYQILVASSADKASNGQGDVWDSGRVSSSQSINVEYAGRPLESGSSYYWRVKTWDAQGNASPWSDVQKFSMGTTSKPTRRATPKSPTDGWSWVWYPETPTGGMRYFRREVDMPRSAAVKSATFSLTVDDNFDLFINGKKIVSTGRTHNAWKTIRTVDVTSALRAGANCLAISAYNKGDMAGATGALSIELADGSTKTTHLDGDWRCAKSARDGWDRPGFDDSRWQHARVLGKYGMAPWKRTAQISAAPAKPLADVWPNRYPLVKTDVPPAKVVRLANGHWFIDFGKASFGTVRFTADARAAAEVEVHLGEELGADGRSVQRKPGGTRRYRMMKQPVNSGKGEYTVRVNPDRRNTGGAAIKMPKSVGEVIPFRYCELKGYPGTLDKSDITMVMVHYRFGDDAADFSCSNKTLNEVWEMCKYSIKATSFSGVYVDGDRERIPYEADAYINQLCHYGVDREYTMARYSHEYLMAHPTWPLEWQHHSVLMAWEDYLYTGNPESMREWYDVLAAKTLKALARGDGLMVDDKKKQSRAFLNSINMRRQIRTIIDWPTGERDGHKITPVDAGANAFYYRTLVLMGRIARDLGKNAEAAEWEGDAKRVYESFQRAFFDTGKGIYRDGEGVGHSSIHANMYPLVFELVPPEHVKSVTTFVASRGMACSVYGAQHLMDGLYMAGAQDHALKLMSSTQKRGWYNMIREGSTISMEAWGNKFKGNQDWNHAWGAAPANLIPRRLMGIRPLEAGWKKIIVEPQIGSLTRASVVSPTIRGDVKLDISRSSSRYTMKLTVPANTTAVVSLPTDDPARATEGGRSLRSAQLVEVKGVERGRTVVEVGGGEYSFEIRMR